MNRPIVILDTISDPTEPHDNFSMALEGAQLKMVRQGRSPDSHPHGLQCAYCILSQLSPTQRKLQPIYFMKILDDDYDFVTDTWWMNDIARLKPAFINFSVGAHHKNQSYLDRLLKRRYTQETNFVEKFLKLLEATDSQLFAAAGNDDSSTRRYVDRDNDVAYPQKLMAHSKRVHIIGACDIIGRPSTFSSDGLEVEAMYWGQKVPVINPFTGVTEYISGTSFATPFALGDAVRRNLYAPGSVNNYIYEKAIRTGNWPKDQRHPKAGYGGMMPSLRGNFRYSKLNLMKQWEELNRLEVPIAEAWHDLSKITAGDSTILNP